MRVSNWILSVLFVAVGLGVPRAFAAPAPRANGCISQTDMQDIANHFSQFNNLAKAEFCYDGSPTSNLLETIMFMRNTPFSASMPKSSDELFSGIFAKDWWGYFTGRIHDFDVQSDCPKGVGAFVYGWGDHTMYVCPLILSTSFTSLDRASVFMHEARHIDGYPHITCSHGPRAGLGGACDQRISDTGSYAVTVETYAQLGEYAPNLHPALKAYARESAVIYGDEAFETPVQINRTEQFLLMTTNREFYKLESDGSASVQRYGDAPALGRIVMRAKHMILFPDDRTQPAKYVFSHNEGDVQQQAGDLAAEYNSQSPAERAELKDMHIAAQWSARLYQDHLHFSCDPTSADTQDVSTGGQVPVATLYPNGYDRANKSALFISESGAVMEFGCQSRNAYVRASTTKFDQTYKRVYRSGNEVLGLSKDGRLFEINGNTSKALQTSVDGQIFELVPVEDYAFFN